jgi:hypothetical protein
MAMRPGIHVGRPYLSVVIPTLNEAERIGATVERLIAPDIEVIVADGGSRDGDPDDGPERRRNGHRDAARSRMAAK